MKQNIYVKSTFPIWRTKYWDLGTFLRDKFPPAFGLNENFVLYFVSWNPCFNLQSNSAYNEA